MGYYDGTALNYYYYMASQFGTSDRWFSPVMTRTGPNREYLIAATSQGDVYPTRHRQWGPVVPHGHNNFSAIAERGNHLEDLRQYRQHVLRVGSLRHNAC